MAKLVRAEIGWLGELAVDQVNLIHSGGRLIPWIPLVDSHGVDRAYTWEGVGAPSFVQVKTSGFTDDEGRHRWDLRVGSFAPSPQFSVVLSVFDPAPKQITNVFWKIDSVLVPRLGRREHDRALRADVYRLDASPTHQDRLAPYRHTGDVLWREFVPKSALGATPSRTLPDLRIDQGGVYEFAMITELMRGNHKDLLLFRPAFDIRGRDLLIQKVGTSHAVFVQIKGTALLRGQDLVRFHVRRSTFVPADDFWFAFHFWDRRISDFFPECWLASSKELARRTAHQRDRAYLTVDVRLDPALDRWADCRYPIHDQADVLRAALHRFQVAA
jgi:hypothetical protein